MHPAGHMSCSVRVRVGVCVCGTSEQTLNFAPGLVVIYFTMHCRGPQACL